MPDPIRVPGIQWPESTGDLKIDAVFKNIFDNLTYFKNLAETLQSTVTSLESRIAELEDA